MRIKLPSPKRGEGKVLGRHDVTTEGEDDGEDHTSSPRRENIILRAADAAESSGFRALLSGGEDIPLAVAPPFAGQVQ